MAGKKLTHKQDRFVEEFIIDLSIKKAAERSELDYNYCRRLVTESHILEAIEKAKEERSKRTKIDADYVLKQAGKLHKICMGEKEVTNLTSSKHVFNVSGAAKALDLIGRHVGVRAFELSEVPESKEPIPDEFL